MKSALDFHDSHISCIDLTAGDAVIFFSHATVHQSQGKPGRDPGASWSREARLTLCEAELSKPLPPLPNTIEEGVLEVGGIRHDLLPIPFQRKVKAVLRLSFVDGSSLEIAGKRPSLELLGRPTLIGDFP